MIIFQKILISDWIWIFFRILDLTHSVVVVRIIIGKTTTTTTTKNIEQKIFFQKKNSLNFFLEFCSIFFQFNRNRISIPNSETIWDFFEKEFKLTFFFLKFLMKEFSHKILFDSFGKNSVWFEKVNCFFLVFQNVNFL